MIIYCKRSRRTATTAHVGYRQLESQKRILRRLHRPAISNLAFCTSVAGQAISRFSPDPPIGLLLLVAAMVSFTSLYWALVRDTLPDGGVVFGDEEQDTSSPQAIVAQCELFMQKNLLTGSAFGYNYSFNRPSSFKYSPSQWLWGKVSSTARPLSLKAGSSE